jgi:plastocyanin
MIPIKILSAISVFLFICTAATVGATGDNELGSVCGTVTVWKTRVKTDGPKSGKDVLLYLEDKNGKTFSPSDEKLSMDQKGLVFIPHVLPVQKGGTVTFLNNDTVDHNVYFLFENTGETLDIGTWGYGISKDHQFNESGLVITLCKLHLEMAAYIVVMENPYYTLTKIDAESQKATYCIDRLPPGDYTLRAWHKKLKIKGKSVEISVKGGVKTTCDVVMTKAKYAK